VTAVTTLAALVSGTGWHVADLLRAAETLAIKFHPLPFARVEGRVGGDSGAGLVVDGVNLSHVDGILIRMMPPGSLEQVVFRMDALHRLAARRLGGCHLRWERIGCDGLRHRRRRRGKGEADGPCCGQRERMRCYSAAHA